MAAAALAAGCATPYQNPGYTGAAGLPGLLGTGNRYIDIDWPRLELQDLPRLTVSELPPSTAQWDVPPPPPPWDPYMAPRPEVAPGVGTAAND